MIYQCYNENEITLILVENIYMNCYAGQVTIANIKTCIYLINKIHFQISMLLSIIYRSETFRSFKICFLYFISLCLNIIVNLIFALLINQYFFEITKKSAFVILLCVVVVGFIFFIFFLNIEHH